MPRSACRDGYALLAVLWISAAIAALGITVSAAARDAMTSSRNRVATSKAEWLAEGCLARARSLIARALDSGQGRPQGEGKKSFAWQRLDWLLDTPPESTANDCTITSTAVGARIDVNAADQRWLARLLTFAGNDPARSDSAAAALADWKDADDEPRPLGAEQAWYERRDRIPPRNRPLADRREIDLVKGMASLDWEGVLDVEPGPISINHAPRSILAALPGFSTQAVARVVELRQRGRTFRHFREIADLLPAHDASTVMDAVPALVSLASFEPPAWLVRAEARAGAPPVSVVIELRLERAGARSRVARRKVWTR